MKYKYDTLFFLFYLPNNLHHVINSFTNLLIAKYNYFPCFYADAFNAYLIISTPVASKEF